MIPILASQSWSGVGLRAGVIAGALVVWFWTQSLIARKAAAKEGIGDVVHNLTSRWHRYLSTNERAANAALIASSICNDLLGLALIGSAIFVPTFAPFLAILIVFALRQVCQSLCTLPPPPGIIWRNPGFPALLVTYEVGNDFFFSGHTALAVLGAIEAAPPALRSSRSTRLAESRLLTPLIATGCVSSSPHNWTTARGTCRRGARRSRRTTNPATHMARISSSRSWPPAGRRRRSRSRYQRPGNCRRGEFGPKARRAVLFRSLNSDYAKRGPTALPIAGAKRTPTPARRGSSTPLRRRCPAGQTARAPSRRR